MNFNTVQSESFFSWLALSENTKNAELIINQAVRILQESEVTSNKITESVETDCFEFIIENSFIKIFKYKNFFTIDKEWALKNYFSFNAEQRIALVNKLLEDINKKTHNISIIDQMNSLWNTFTVLKNDKNFIKTVFNNYSPGAYPSLAFRSLLYIDDNLKGDRDFVLEIIERNGFALKCFNERFLKDKEIVLKAVSNNGDVLKIVPEDLRKDRDVVKTAVNNNGVSLFWADEILGRDKEIVLQAVKNNGKAIKFLFEEQKKDREIVIEAVKQDGVALSEALPIFKKDKEVVLIAAQNCTFPLFYHYAFPHADPLLKYDEDVLLETVLCNRQFKSLTKKEWGHMDIFYPYCQDTEYYQKWLTIPSKETHLGAKFWPLVWDASEVPDEVKLNASIYSKLLKSRRLDRLERAGLLWYMKECDHLKAIYTQIMIEEVCLSVKLKDIYYHFKNNKE